MADFRDRRQCLAAKTQRLHAKQIVRRLSPWRIYSASRRWAFAVRPWPPLLEISHLLIRSRTAESQACAELAIQGGNPLPVTPCGCPVGTIIEVRNLFFNTPVRCRFMPSSPDRVGTFDRGLYADRRGISSSPFYAAPQRPCAFRSATDGSWSERITACVGPEIGSDLIWVESDEGSVALAEDSWRIPARVDRTTDCSMYFSTGDLSATRALQHAPPVRPIGGYC